jgi:hypothetical protein
VATALKKSATAAPQAAGYILQLERALFHLSAADSDVSVAVEHADDVARVRDGVILAQEQDKHTVRPGVDLLANRSKGLWRTLQIWLESGESVAGSSCASYMLVTNSVANGSIAAALRDVRTNKISAAKAVGNLRSDWKPKSKSKVQSIIDDVLTRSDEILGDLLSRVELLDNLDRREDRVKLANGFAIDPGVNADTVLDALLGWLTRVLMDLWQDGKPGIISREACVRQCRQIERSLARQRLLPRPASDVAIGSEDRRRAMTRPFVAHLGRIDSESDLIYEAVDHFLQFNVEKHRLAAGGEIPLREWQDRGNRLQLRWRGVVRRVKLEHGDQPAIMQGKHILARSTFDHLEPLFGLPCEELYMTAGHYHRLADENEVWWDPSFQQGS